MMNTHYNISYTHTQICIESSITYIEDSILEALHLRIILLLGLDLLLLSLQYLPVNRRSESLFFYQAVNRGIKFPFLNQAVNRVTGPSFFIK